MEARLEAPAAGGQRAAEGWGASVKRTEAGVCL